MGEQINHLFESQMQWSYDNGLIYINGRDVVAFIIGFCVCIVVMLTISYIRTEIKERKNKNGQIHRSKEIHRTDEKSN